MYKFDEKSLKEGIRMGLGSQGIWTPQLENVMFDEITSKALRKHDVVGRSEQFKCGKCNSNWGEIRATCFECGYESEDLST